MPASRAIKDEVVKLVKAGKVDEARDMFAFDNLAKLEYIYGPANRPELFRSALGNLGGVLLSYPLNTAELIRIFGKEAIQEGNPGHRCAKTDKGTVWSATVKFHEGLSD